MDELIGEGEISRGYLALVPQDLDENLAKALNLKSTEGALIGEVTTGGPADKAGIKNGDVITAFNGKPVRNSAWWSRKPIRGAWRESRCSGRAGK
jgi:S1-C subfamily serine protease